MYPFYFIFWFWNVFNVYVTIPYTLLVSIDHNNESGEWFSSLKKYVVSIPTAKRWKSNIHLSMHMFSISNLFSGLSTHRWSFIHFLGQKVQKSNPMKTIWAICPNIWTEGPGAQNNLDVLPQKYLDVLRLDLLTFSPFTDLRDIQFSFDCFLRLFLFIYRVYF